MDFIMGHMLCLYVKVTPPKNSEFYLHFWPLAPHIGGAFGANGKRLKNFETTFIYKSNIPHDGIAFGFKRFQLLDKFSANL